MQNMFYGASAFNQDLSSWNIKTVGNLGSFLTDTNLSTYNYNALLAGWASNPEVKPTITFGASPAQYGGCPTEVSNALAGSGGRATLVAKSWGITDGGAAP
jgi:surface protein